MNSCIVWVFCKILFSNKLDLINAICSIILALRTFWGSSYEVFWTPSKKIRVLENPETVWLFPIWVLQKRTNHLRTVLLKELEWLRVKNTKLLSNILWLIEPQYKRYKKRFVSRVNPSLLLKIKMYNIWTLQFININQMKLSTKDN